MSVVCLGKFDALHRGHRALAACAAASGDSVWLVCFSGMAEALGWQPRLPLTAPTDRARILASWPGAPSEVALPFAEIRELDATAFVRLIAHRLGATTVVVGEDFRGGRGRYADVAAFAAAGRSVGVSVQAVAAVADEYGPVSSTRVRSALAAGDLASVEALLGRRHRLLGTVVHGDGRGKKIGIPTANLGHRENQEPGAGVYAAWAFIADHCVPAVVNIGNVPTAGEDRPLTVEAHLLDWQGDCYDSVMAFECVQRIRTEQRFASFSDLVAQIHTDIAKARSILSA